MQKVELQTAQEGTKIELINLRGINALQQRKLARKINSVTRSIYDNGQHVPLGTPLFGLARPKYVVEQEKRIAKDGSSLCDVILVEDEIAGVRMSSYSRPGNTPILISRPKIQSRRIEYWLRPEYAGDQTLNDLVVKGLTSNADTVWQWDYVNPEYEPHRADAYSRVGFVALTTSRDEWIRTFNGSGIKNTELWAKAPRTDNQILADHMSAISEEIGRLGIIEDKEWAERFPDLS